MRFPIELQIVQLPLHYVAKNLELLLEQSNFTAMQIYQKVIKYLKPKEEKLRLLK